MRIGIINSDIKRSKEMGLNDKLSYFSFSCHHCGAILFAMAFHVIISVEDCPSLKKSHFPVHLSPQGAPGGGPLGRGARGGRPGRPPLPPWAAPDKTLLRVGPTWTHVSKIES